jgi:hypothetical protein
MTETDLPQNTDLLSNRIRTFSILALAGLWALFSINSTEAQSFPPQVARVQLTVSSQGATKVYRDGTVALRIKKRRMDAEDFLKIAAQDHAVIDGYPVGSKLMLQEGNFVVLKGTNMVDDLSDVLSFNNISETGGLMGEVINTNKQKASLFAKFIGDVTYQSASNNILGVSNSLVLHCLITLNFTQSMLDRSNQTQRLTVVATAQGFGSGTLQAEDVIITGAMTLNGSTTFSENDLAVSAMKAGAGVNSPVGAKQLLRFIR